MLYPREKFLANYDNFRKEHLRFRRIFICGYLGLMFLMYLMWGYIVRPCHQLLYFQYGGLMFYGFWVLQIAIMAYMAVVLRVQSKRNHIICPDCGRCFSKSDVQIIVKNGKCPKCHKQIIDETPECQSSGNQSPKPLK
jgi:hypothetical protein